jgi:hypothetical protein
MVNAMSKNKYFYEAFLPLPYLLTMIGICRVSKLGHVFGADLVYNCLVLLRTKTVECF